MWIEIIRDFYTLQAAHQLKWILDGSFERLIYHAKEKWVFECKILVLAYWRWASYTREKCTWKKLGPTHLCMFGVRVSHQRNGYGEGKQEMKVMGKDYWEGYKRARSLYTNSPGNACHNSLNSMLPNWWKTTTWCSYQTSPCHMVVDVRLDGGKICSRMPPCPIEVAYSGAVVPEATRFPRFAAKCRMTSAINSLPCCQDWENLSQHQN